MKHLDDAISALTELKNKTAPVEEHEEEDEVKKEDIAKAVQAAIQPIVKQVEGLVADVTELKKQEGEGADPATSTEGGNETQSDALADVIAKALAPLQEQMTTLAADVQLVKNSRGGSAQGGASDEDIQKSADGVSFGGLL
ncbi:hypothetical protein ABE142_15030 [Paenibacillus alvei]|uniref:hypothetical protein n=1 Tax=Paenibacillus alvei TaxID=44250 RepID=UPI003D27562B